MLEYRSSEVIIIKGTYLQIPFKLAANLWKKLRRVKFLRIETYFLTIALSLTDIELGLKSPMESSFFPLMCNQWLVENMLAWVKRPHNFKYRTRLSMVFAKSHWSVWYQIVSVSWLSSKKNVTLCFKLWLQDQFHNQNIGSFVSWLLVALNKGSPRELVP